MIRIDKESNEPVQQQLAGRLRYLIASGQLRTGDRLPATRRLADQLGISYHTVRKAYAHLAEDGLVESAGRRGYLVLQARPLGKSERMERGASLVAEVLETLVGIGLDEQEIEYLVQEQVALLSADQTAAKIMVAAAFMELAVACADALTAALQRECQPVLLTDIENHTDADVILVPFRHVRTVMAAAIRADVVGFRYEMGEEAVEAIARLLDHETLGLITREADSIGALTSEIRTVTRFSGQVVAVSVKEGDNYIAPLLRQCDLLVYTERAERRVRPFLERARKHQLLGLGVAASSIGRIREVIP